MKYTYNKVWEEMTYVKSISATETLETSSSHGHLKELLCQVTKGKIHLESSLQVKSNIWRYMSQKLSHNMKYYAAHACES